MLGRHAAGRVREVIERKLLLDGMVTHTGDDIALVMSHTHGVGAPDVNRFAWDTFIAATEEARAAGLYGAGQNLLVDAPVGERCAAPVRPWPRSNSNAIPMTWSPPHPHGQCR